VLFVGDEGEKQALLSGEPELFFTTPGYDGLPLVMLRFVTGVWLMRAPDALRGDLDHAGGSSGAEPD
jgi:hypothetical protein